MKGTDWADIIGYWFAESIGEFVCTDCISMVDMRTRPHVVWTWDDVNRETGPLVCDRCGYHMVEKGESPDSARVRLRKRAGA